MTIANAVFGASAMNVATGAPAATRVAGLDAGQQLARCHSVESPHRMNTLAMQCDGNLVLYAGHRAVWSTGTRGSDAQAVVMQRDGNFVLYGARDEPLWSSGTPGAAGAVLRVQDDGNAVIYAPGHRAAWATNTVQPVPPPPPTIEPEHGLVSGGALTSCQAIASTNRRFVLVMQCDGNLVLYDTGVARWSTGTSGRGATRVILQGDGNLVVYDAHRVPLWNSDTAGHPNAHLDVQDDGNVVVYTAQHAPVWASGTSVAANPKRESAIAWFMARLGSSAYEGLCETTVENAFGTSSRYPTAMADWNAQTARHTDWWNAPRGTLVFYNTSSRGHVALSLGNGEVISTSIHGRIGIAPIGWLQRPLGWAESPW